MITVFQINSASGIEKPLNSEEGKFNKEDNSTSQKSLQSNGYSTAAFELHWKDMNYNHDRNHLYSAQRNMPNSGAFFLNKKQKDEHFMANKISFTNVVTFVMGEIGVGGGGRDGEACQAMKTTRAGCTESDALWGKSGIE